MYRDTQTAAIISVGMQLLREKLGVIESEIFISELASNEFDYTKWRENLWEDLTPEELFERARKTSEKYAIQKNVQII